MTTARIFCLWDFWSRLCKQKLHQQTAWDSGHAYRPKLSGQRTEAYLIEHRLSNTLKCNNMPFQQFFRQSYAASQKAYLLRPGCSPIAVKAQTPLQKTASHAGFSTHLVVWIAPTIFRNIISILQVGALHVSLATLCMDSHVLAFVDDSTGNGEKFRGLASTSLDGLRRASGGAGWAGGEGSLVMPLTGSFAAVFAEGTCPARMKSKLQPYIKKFSE